MLLALPAGAEPRWTVHEWGTFTSLQNESGDAIGGINTDDEPVPPFVHRLDGSALLTPTEAPPSFFKGAPSCHPDVTMRLETPVVYFHPPAGLVGTPTASVTVNFHGGWLSEFFPDAEAYAPGLKDRTNQFPPLLSSTESRLAWKDLHIGGVWPLTNTSAHVWTSPRAANTASVHTTGGESEKFLFYRGIAHINAPLKISRDPHSGELLFRSQLENLPADPPLRLNALWLVDIQPGGKIAYRTLPPVALKQDSKSYLAHTPAAFAPGDFGPGNLEKLKASLLAALVVAGLYPDEAQALLNTWEESYFKSTGLRVFFLVPRAWTDFYLPLDVSVPANLNRVMVGRIELVTPAQRDGLQEIARTSTNDIAQAAGRLAANFYGRLFSAITNQSNGAQMQRFNVEMALVNAGQKPLSNLLSIPKSYQTYLDLGRFRNALILDEAKHHPTEGLASFIAAYRLQACQPLAAAAQPPVVGKL